VKTPKRYPAGKGSVIYKKRVQVGSRMDLFMRGELTADDLTEEELLTGTLNDKNGDRSVRPHNLIPREFHTAVVRRLIEIGEGKLQSAYLEAAENIVAIALGDPEKVETREYDNGKLVGSENRSYDPVVLKAAQYVFERIGGKTPEVVAATVEVKPWEDTMQRLATVFNAGPGMARSASPAIGDTAPREPEGNGAHD
jgi:hypothetical protein